MQVLMTRATGLVWTDLRLSVGEGVIRHVVCYGRQGSSSRIRT
jgi:hypothetical protein